MTRASPIDASILTQFLESTIRISREPALDKCLTPLGRYPPPPWFGDLGTMNLSTKLLIASLPAMPATEANTMAIVSSMQLKISGFTTEPVTLLGSDLRTKNMRMKLMIETLGSLVSLIDHGIIYCAERREVAYIAPTNNCMPTVILLCKLIFKSASHTTGTLKITTSVIRFAIPVPSQPWRWLRQLPSFGVHAAARGLHSVR